MELLYFISGILTVGVIYGVILLRNIKSSHAELLEKNQLQSNISSLRLGETMVEVNSIRELIIDIQSNMEKDQYQNLSKINKDIESLRGITLDTKSKLEFAMGSSDKNFSSVFSEIQQLKTNFKALSQDNFIR
jgi:hypothetical protein